MELGTSLRRRPLGVTGSSLPQAIDYYSQQHEESKRVRRHRHGFLGVSFVPLQVAQPGEPVVEADNHSGRNQPCGAEDRADRERSHREVPESNFPHDRKGLDIVEIEDLTP
jgi:hypothetical protein